MKACLETTSMFCSREKLIGLKENELLACVLRTDQFHTYVFGHAFTIESDHKPCEQINIKNLADTPVCLKRMLLQLHKYDVTIKY